MTRPTDDILADDDEFSETGRHGCLLPTGDGISESSGNDDDDED